MIPTSITHRHHRVQRPVLGGEPDTHFFRRRGGTSLRGKSYCAFLVENPMMEQRKRFLSGVHLTLHTRPTPLRLGGLLPQ